jgi:hypothetical protein
MAYIKDRYGDLPVLQPPHQPSQADRREFVCIRCGRGQCARCNDRACTCCYGNED